MSKVISVIKEGKFQIEYELEPAARLFAQALAMRALVKKLADAGLPFGDEPHDIDDSDVLEARAIIDALEES